MLICIQQQGLMLTDQSQKEDAHTFTYRENFQLRGVTKSTSQQTALLSQRGLSRRIYPHWGVSTDTFLWMPQPQGGYKKDGEDSQSELPCTKAK